MTARKANPKPQVGITINPRKAQHTLQATLPFDEVQRRQQDRPQAHITYATPTTPATAQASTDNLFKRLPYTPPANTYQRNSGHPDITSHGVRC